MKCRYCGQLLDDKAEFCINCGMKIPLTQITVEPGARIPGSRSRKGISAWLKGSVIGGVLGVVFIIIGILLIISSIASFLDSAVGAGDDPLGAAKDILGGFGIMIVGAVLISIGGTLIFFSFIGFIIGAIDSR
ncbi:MAG: hypothetical protein A3K76_01300 [Euryarchaeota archaeon RBG_13_57_23]|nr:MAG: hypothetical protein A3K76_01300 [Euryarchaeota archaeon RBG_13_57_23]